MNECFIEYKDKHIGKSAVLFGTGPTIDLYKDINKDIIKIGCNEIVHRPNLMMDYYFIGDPGNKQRGYNSNPEIYNKYKPNIAKFIRHESHVYKPLSKLPNNIPYSTYYITTHLATGLLANQYPQGDFEKDISKRMGDGGSIIFEALQFILYTGIQNLYIVGNDCNYTRGTFHTNKPLIDPSGGLSLRMWKQAKEFIEREYPNVNVYIINPVSMREFKELKEEDIK